MADGTEVDERVTEELVEQGYWPPGTLILLDKQVFVIIGYSFWGWIHDCDDSEVFYDVTLHHVGTSIVSCFPLLKIVQKAEIYKEEK